MEQTKIETILIRILVVVAGIIFAGLSIISMIFSYVNVDLPDEHVYRVTDNIVLNIVAVVVIFGLLVILNRRCFKNIEKINTNIVAMCLSAVAVVLSILWILGSGTEVQADQWKICDAAVQINNGNYEGFDKGNYLAECPHQLGIITLLRLIFAVFGEWNYLPFQILSAISVGVTIYYTYKLASVMTGIKSVELIATILTFICVPLYFYTPFVYGEVPSIALSVVAMYLFTKLCDSFSKKGVTALVIVVACMLLIRKNTVIILIAMLGILCVRFLIKHDRKYLIIIAGIVVGMLLKSAVIGGLYNSHIPEDSYEIPSILYIAMGTNDYGNYAGWFDGMHHAIFEANGFDPVPASAEGKQVIADFVKTCVNDHVYGIKFFFRKIGGQWIAPMYQSLVMNNNITGEQSSFARFIYYDKNAWRVLDGVMNIYQLIIYIAITFALAHSWKSQKKLSFYTGMIAVFGGFVFSIIWETKTRYVFPYLFLMVPYAAWGIYLIVTSMKAGRKEKVLPEN